MEVLGPATEAEVVETFVRAERESTRFGGLFAAARERLQTNRADALLAAVRGYPDQALFAGLPPGVHWQRVRLTREESHAVLHLNYGDWCTILTDGTRAPTALAKKLRRHDLGNHNLSEIVPAIAGRYRRGEALPEPILVSDGSRIVCLEGNARLAAYVLADVSTGLDAYLGTHAEMAQWPLF